VDRQRAVLGQKRKNFGTRMNDEKTRDWGLWFNTEQKHPKNRKEKNKKKKDEVGNQTTV